jgi:hypothetical protein
MALVMNLRELQHRCRRPSRLHPTGKRREGRLALLAIEQ